MNDSPVPIPRCPFCNSAFQSERDLPEGAQVHCQRCAETFTLKAPVAARVATGGVDAIRSQSAVRQRSRGIRWTLAMVLGTMAALAVAAIVFINQTQPSRRQRDLPALASDPGELVGLVAEGADCIMRLDGTWLVKNRVDSLTQGTPFAFFADAVAQIPKNLGFSKIDELMVGIPGSAPFSSRFAAGLGASWNPASIQGQFNPVKVAADVYRVKVQGWPLSLDLKQVQPERVVAMLAKSSGESAVEKLGSSAAPMADQLKAMRADRIPKEAPFWLVAKKEILPKKEIDQKKPLSAPVGQNGLIRLLEADWTVIGVWIEMPVEAEQLGAGALRSAMVLRMELVFDDEKGAEQWEKARTAEKTPGWKSVREKKTVSVQWKGFLESSWK